MLQGGKLPRHGSALRRPRRSHPGRAGDPAMKVLVIDVGGTYIKVGTGAPDESTKIRSGQDMTPERMAQEVKQVTAGWGYDVVTIGYPGPVVNGRPAVEPRNLGAGWVGFDYEKAFGR